VTHVLPSEVIIPHAYLPLSTFSPVSSSTMNAPVVELAIPIILFFKASLMKSSFAMPFAINLLDIEGVRET